MNNKRMTLRDRIKIQNEIDNNGRSSVATIAHKTGFNTSSIYREIKKNRISFGSKSVKFNKSRQSLDCPSLSKFPYVCNQCKKRNKCSKEIWEYDTNSWIYLIQRIINEYRLFMIQ